MPAVEYRIRLIEKGPQACSSEMDRIREKVEGRAAADSGPTPMRTRSITRPEGGSAPWREGKFLKCLSHEAMTEFESLAAPFYCEEATVLFAEEELPGKVLFLIEGTVRLSLNSMGGRRLTLGIAEPGDILGLAAAVSGCPYETSAEAQFLCRIAPIPRPLFLDFLLRYPAANLNVTRQLSLEHKRACDQLRILGLTLTAPEKLARLLLEWCAEGRQTARGARIHCPLTHGEIGEYIGVARETVSRTMADFKNRKLVEQHGTTLVISSLRALEIYAERLDC
jgi:CRP/FNR family transcriptional regulator, cyclic AMP receptor protein